MNLILILIPAVALAHLDTGWQYPPGDDNGFVKLEALQCYLHV
jgi:hypothetical protein